MKRKFSPKLSIMHRAIGALLLSAAGSAIANPLYAPTGPQLGVAFSTVTSGGWTECFSQPYGQTGTTVASAVSGCTGDLLMMAGTRNGATAIQLLAWAPKADVLFATAPNAVHTANGANWYFNESSWGFTPGGIGAVISQQSADVNCSPGWSGIGCGTGETGDARLSWHTGGDGTLAGTTINGGWRVGNDVFLNSEPSDFTRYLFTANSSATVPEPTGLALLGLGLAMCGAVRKRRKK